MTAWSQGSMVVWSRDSMTSAWSQASTILGRGRDSTIWLWNRAITMAAWDQASTTHWTPCSRLSPGPPPPCPPPPPRWWLAPPAPTRTRAAPTTCRGDPRQSASPRPRPCQVRPQNYCPKRKFGHFMSKYFNKIIIYLFFFSLWLSE